MNEKEVMKVALIYAEKHGQCKRRKIACFIMDENGNCIGRGSNGPVGFSCHDNPCPGADVPAGQGAYQEVDCYGIHAEARALMEASPYAEDAHIIFCTKAPCKRCAEMLIHATQAQRLVFAVWPNDKSGLQAWDNAGSEYACSGDL